MPTYEYRCPEGHTFEVFQKMSDPPGAACPQCGKAGERQLSGGAGVLFKGSGFYITDYRSEDYKKAAASEARGGAPSAGEGKGGSGEGKSGGGEGKGSGKKDVRRAASSGRGETGAPPKGGGGESGSGGGGAGSGGGGDAG